MSNAALSHIHADPKLIFELAARVEPPEVIAANYDLDPAFLAEMVELPHVKKMIKAKKKELDDAGWVLASKAKLMFEDLLADVYKKAKSPDAGLSSVLETAKFMRTVAGLDRPEADKGERFGITINIGGSAGPVTVDVDPSNRPGGAKAETPPATFDIAFKEFDDLESELKLKGTPFSAPKPAYLLGAMLHAEDLVYVSGDGV